MLTRIREVRKATGLTLHEVAARCEPPTTAQTIGRLETGTRTVSVAWLNRIAKALDVAPSALVTLPERIDTPVTVLLTADGAIAPKRPMTLLPPTPTVAMIGMRIEVAQGDYRAGDSLWLERLTPRQFSAALNHDVLVPRPAGRFVFGRLAATAEGRVQLLPLTPGARQLIVADAPWIAVARMLMREL